MRSDTTWVRRILNTKVDTTRRRDVFSHSLATGLYHTFENAQATENECYPGDFVEDTNPEANPRYDCPEGATSCGSADPIHNYMDCES